MKTRTLVICGDLWHAAETVRRGLSSLADAGFDCEFLAEGAKCPAEIPDEFSVLVLAKANMISAADQRPWLNEDSQAAFQFFLQRGKGLLVIHAGSAGYGELPVMRRAMGGAFVHHPPQCTVTLNPKAGHPLTKGVVPFKVNDEHYFVKLDDAHADVFLHSQSEHGDQPAGWARIAGESRVCVLTPGHNLEVWLQPAFQKLLLNVLRWTANSD